MKKRILLLCFSSLMIIKGHCQCFVEATVPYDIFNGNSYLHSSGSATTTNTYVYQLSCPMVTTRATVNDGLQPRLLISAGLAQTTQAIVPPGFTINAPDVAIVTTEGCNKFYYLVVFRKGSNYFLNFYQAPCTNPTNITNDWQVNVSPNAPASNYGIHIDADERGNFAIVYTVLVGAEYKTRVRYGFTDCDGPHFCESPAYFDVTSGTPTNQFDPDVTVAPNSNGSDDIYISYVNGLRTRLYVHTGRFSGCHNQNSVNQTTCAVYTAAPGFSLYTPRMASEPYPINSGQSAYSVVFLEKNSTQYFVKGGTWDQMQNPGSPCSIFNNVRTYNNGSESGTVCDYSGLPTDHPVVTYNDHITSTCSSLFIGWNVDKGSPENKDVEVVRCRPDDGSVNLSYPNAYNINNGNPASGNQYGLSLDARYANDGVSSIQYIFIDNADADRIKGKYTTSCILPLRPASSNVTSNIERLDNEESLSIYPNPVDHNLNVWLPASTEAGKLVIYNILGTVMKEVTIDVGEKEIKIDTESLSPGSYFIQLRSNENTIIAKGTFVKQ